jgi:hypothetical protein
MGVTKDRDDHFPVLVKVSCGRLGMGNAECASHERQKKAIAMCNTQWASGELYKGIEKTTFQPNIIKASCSRLAP